MNKDILKFIKSISNNNEIQKILIKTIGNILLKQDDFELFIKKNENKIIHIRDWISSVVENHEEWKTPRVLTLDALNNAADKYFEKQNNKLKKIELNENHEKLIADLNGYYIVQMLTPEALDNESKQMQHCIGHGYYDQKVTYKEYQYLSLRDKFNNAHATLEITNKIILQLQGKQNKIPDKKYLEILLPWLIDKKYMDISYLKFGYYLDENNNLKELKNLNITENKDFIKFNSHNLDITESINKYFTIYHIFNKIDFAYNMNNRYGEFNLKYIINDKYYFYEINNKRNYLSFNQNKINETEFLNVIQFLYDNGYKNIISKYSNIYNENEKICYIKDIKLNDSDLKIIQENKESILKQIISKKSFIFYKYMNQIKFEYNKENNFYILTFNNNQYFLITKDNNLCNIQKINKQNINNTKLPDILNHIYSNFKINIDPETFNCYQDENNIFYSTNDIVLKENIDFYIKKQNNLEIKIGKNKKFLAYNKKFYGNYFNIIINNNFYIKTDNENNIDIIHEYPRNNKNNKKEILKYLINNQYKNINTGLLGLFINETDSEIYSNKENQYPKNIIIKDNINFSLFNKFDCFENITFENNFTHHHLKKDFSFDKITILKDIDISNSQIEILPNTFNVNGNLSILNCKNIKNIPEEITVNGNFNAENTKHNMLSKKLIVKGNLNINNAKIEKIADDIKIDGDINGINACNLKELPDNLYINGNLTLTGTKIKEFPQNMSVKKSFTISSIILEKLPDNLIVGDTLTIKYCNNLKIIQETIKCEKIIIHKKHIKLISNIMDFKIIQIDKDIYIKEEFFIKFKNENTLKI